MEAYPYNEENCKRFQQIMMQLVVYDPDMCSQLLRRVVVKEEEILPFGFWKWLRILRTPRPVRHTYSEYPKVLMADEPAFSEAQKNFANHFVELCEKVRNQHDSQSEWQLQSYLRELYQSDAARAILFLLKRADEQTLRQFSVSHLGQEETARMATVDIVVRKNEGLERITGNTGQYLIYTRKGVDGEERLLKFTNQASTVYYLMFLISHCQPNRVLPFVELRNNTEVFFELYQQVYDDNAKSLYSKIKNLLFRIDNYGNVRAGRLNEIVYDIRKHLELRFEEYGESFQPYAMTATRPLSVGAERIHFMGAAQQLLMLEFV